LEFGQAPGLAAQAAGAQLDASFEVALVLLQVLRPQEQPLAPDDLVVLRHPLAARPSRRPRTQDKPCPGRTAAVRSGRARTARPAARILASLPERGPTIRLSGRRGAGPISAASAAPRRPWRTRRRTGSGSIRPDRARCAR